MGFQVGGGETGPGGGGADLRRGRVSIAEGCQPWVCRRPPPGLGGDGAGRASRRVKLRMEFEGLGLLFPPRLRAGWLCQLCFAPRAAGGGTGFSSGAWLGVELLCCSAKLRRRAAARLPIVWGVPPELGLGNIPKKSGVPCWRRRPETRCSRCQIEGLWLGASLGRNTPRGLIWVQHLSCGTNATRSCTGWGLAQGHAGEGWELAASRERRGGCGLEGQQTPCPRSRASCCLLVSIKGCGSGTGRGACLGQREEVEKHEIGPYLRSNPCARAKLGPGLVWGSRCWQSLGHLLGGGRAPQTKQLLLNKGFVGVGLLRRSLGRCRGKVSCVGDLRAGEEQRRRRARSRRQESSASPHRGG